MPLDPSQFLGGLREHNRQTMARLLDGCNQFAASVLADAQYLCPVETGDLKASAKALPAVWDGQHIVVDLGFNTTYAAAVHEVLTAAHEPPTQAKYLETPLRIKAKEFGAFMADHVAGSEGGQ